MINTTSYTVNLSSYSIGADAYKQIPHAARFLGKKVAVIGGKTALSKAKDAILEGVAGSDIEILDFIWYGGECTHENSHMLMDLPAVQEADILFAVGGGRAIDTVKYAAHLMAPLHLPHRGLQLCSLFCSGYYVLSRRQLSWQFPHQALQPLLHQLRYYCRFSGASVLGRYW